MSPTLLEGLVVLILIGVAWQIGLILAPFVRHSLHEQIEALDEASEDELTDDAWQTLENKKENDHGSQLQ
jgi:hypothetical protein